MKIKILKVVCFNLILLAILAVLSHYLVPKNNLSKDGMEDVSANSIMAEKENTIDILVVGDSEAYTSIIPMEIWKKYGFTSYVCGTAAQVLPDSMYFTYKTMLTQKPKIVILEADNIYKTVDVNDSFERLINIVLPVTQYHDRWKTINKNDFKHEVDYRFINDLKGYDFSGKIAESDGYNKLAGLGMDNTIPNSNKIYVKLLKKYCESHNAELIILSTPSTVNWDYEKHNEIQKLADKEKIEYIDLNILRDEINIDWKKDTRDGGDHLNHSGVLKVTEFLGKYLYNKNMFKDHRNDKHYKTWDKGLKHYEHLLEENNACTSK